MDETEYPEWTPTMEQARICADHGGMTFAQFDEALAAHGEEVLAAVEQRVKDALVDCRLRVLDGKPMAMWEFAYVVICAIRGVAPIEHSGSCLDPDCLGCPAIRGEGESNE